MLKEGVAMEWIIMQIRENNQKFLHHIHLHDVPVTTSTLHFDVEGQRDDTNWFGTDEFTLL